MILGLVGATAGWVVAGRWDAAACLLAFQDAPPGDLAPGDPPPEGFERLTDRARFGVERAWLCRAPGPRPPVLVFVHGVAPRGIDDGRIVAAVRAFRAGGFTVVAPEMPTLVDPLSPEEVGAGLPRLLRALSSGALEGVHNDRIGLVGVSVGGALALQSAARYQVERGRGLRAVLAIGAPDDMARTAVGWFASADPAPVSDGSLSWERADAAAFARNFLIRAGLVADLGRTPDVRRLADWLALRSLPVEPLVGVEDPRVLARRDLVLASPDVRAAAREEILRLAAPRIRPLSPAAWDEDLAGLRGIAVFLLHGHGDPLVPVEEARRLAERLRRHTIVSLLESHMVGHVSVNDVTLTQRFDHVVLMDDFFDMVGG